MAVTIIWREAMSIDGGVIDRDHKALIAIINEFGDTLPFVGATDHLCNILFKLDKYANTHFRREEYLQKSMNFPEYEYHRLKHIRMIDTLSLLKGEVAMAGERELDIVHKRLTEFTSLAH
jgi:hemerythrin-like metal-binding protein